MNINFSSLAIGQQRLKLSFAPTASLWREGFENSMPTPRTNATINSSSGTVAASRQLLSLGKATKITKQTWMFALLFQWRIGGPLKSVNASSTTLVRPTSIQMDVNKGPIHLPKQFF